MQYAPGIQDQSANIIMQGNQMSQRQGEDMTKIAGYFMERSQKADALRKTLEAYGGVDDEGDPLYDKKMTSGMNVDELEGSLKGLMLSQQRAGQQAVAEEQRARAEEYRAIASERQDRIDQATAQGQAISRYFTAPEVPTMAGNTDQVDPSAGNLGGVTMRAPTHFERIAHALGPEGVSGKFAAPTIKALNDLQELADADPQAQWDTYTPPGVTGGVMVSKRGTKQSFFVPTGLQTQTIDGQDYYYRPRGWTALNQPGAGGKEPTYRDLNDMHLLREKMVTHAQKFSLTADQKAQEESAIAGLDQQISGVQQRLGELEQQRKGGKAGAAPAEATPGRGTGVTKGNAVSGAKTYATPEEVRADASLTNAQKLAILRTQFKFK